MFDQLLSMLGKGNRPQRQAALVVRQRFIADYPDESIGWVEIAEEDDSCFTVCVHYGRKQPKARRSYSVNKESNQVTEIDGN
jgi:hypothetical protein